MDTHVSTALELDTWTGAIMASRELASSTKLVLLVLSQYHPGLCVSQEELGLNCSLSARVVRTHLKIAREKRWVCRERRYDKTGAQAPDQYRLIVQK